MAQFTGTGAFITAGGAVRVYDINFGNLGGLVSTGISAIIRDCEGNINVQGVDSAITGCVRATPVVTGDACRIEGNDLTSPEDGLVVTADDCVMTGNVFNANGSTPSNTFDALVVNGNGNKVQANKFIPSVGNTRHAVNIAGGDCNKVVGNDFGDPADYATSPTNDAGTNTQWFYPADPVYGDNFTDCETSS